MLQARRDRLVGYACAGALVLVWAGFILMSRHGARAGAGGVRMTPWDLAVLRFGVAGVIASALWLAGYGRGLALWRGFVLAVFGGMGFALAAYWGFRFAPAAHSAVLMPGTLPFLVAAGFWLAFGERFSRARTISLGLAAVGALMLGTEAYAFQSAPAGAWRGDLLFLATSTSWATFTVLARRWQVTPLQALVAVGLWPFLLYLPLWWLVLPSGLALVDPHEVVAQAVVQGLFAMVASVVLFTRAMALLGAGRLTTITALTPGLAGVLAVPLLGEHVGPLALAGLALVCIAVIIGVRTPRLA